MAVVLVSAQTAFIIAAVVVGLIVLGGVIVWFWPR